MSSTNIKGAANKRCSTIRSFWGLCPRDRTSGRLKVKNNVKIIAHHDTHLLEWGLGSLENSTHGKHAPLALPEPKNKQVWQGQPGPNPWDTDEAEAVQGGNEKPDPFKQPFHHTFAAALPIRVLDDHGSLKTLLETSRVWPSPQLINLLVGRE